MSRKSYQKVTLSVELTLPPGAKASVTPAYIMAALSLAEHEAKKEGQTMAGLDLNLAVIKILRRETIYTN